MVDRMFERCGESWLVGPLTYLLGHMLGFDKSVSRMKNVRQRMLDWNIQGQILTS